MKNIDIINWGFFILSLMSLGCLIKIIYDAKMEGKRNEEFFKSMSYYKNYKKKEFNNESVTKRRSDE